MEDKKKDRGRFAESPGQIPGSGWKDVLIRIKNEFTRDHLGIVGAGVAFYFFLALFPMLSAVVSIYGLVFDPAQIESHINQLSNALPPQAHDVIAGRLHDIMQTPQQGLGLTLIFSIVLSLWLANSGTKALFEGINIAYNQDEKRNFIKLNATTLAITFGAILAGLFASALVIGFPAVIDKIGFPDFVANALSFGRWPLLFMLISISMAFVYKIAPDREEPKFKWVSWGAFLASLLWVGGSLLFSVYINNFGNYDETYGTVAAVIILMLWFQLTATCILLGAEINSELEHQTEKDTTVGEPAPLGERGAYYADHVAGVEENEPGSSEYKATYRQPETRDRESKERDRFMRKKNKERKRHY